MYNTTIYNELLNNWNSFKRAESDLEIVELLILSIGISWYNGFTITRSKKIDGWFVACDGENKIFAGDLLELMSDVNDTQLAIESVYKSIIYKI